MSSEYKVGDLFSGTGGLSKAFQQAGAEVVFANQIDRYDCILYRENFNDVYMIEGDIRNVDVKNIPNVDILVSSIPCQTFSRAGIKMKNSDNSENLFLEFLRILRAKKPRVFLLETVKGLVSYNNDETIKLTDEVFQNDGYYIKREVLNAMKHGNIPYKKERLYIVGFRDEKECEYFYFPPMIKLQNKLNNFLQMKERKDDKYYCSNTMFHSNLKDLTKSDVIYQIKTVHGQNKKFLEEYDFCPVLYVKNIPLIYDGFDLRKLTPTECFNFQGFFDFKIPKSLSDSNLYNCAIKCSSVTVVERIAKNIIEVMKNKGYLNNKDECTINEVVINEFCEKKLLIDESNQKPISINKQNINTKQKNKLNNFNNQQIIKEFQSEVEQNGSKNNADVLISKLDRIKPGKEQAYIFQNHIYEILNFIFSEYLVRQKKETSIDGGNKRIDIMFDNLADRGFFNELRSVYNIFCPKILIECKNYSVPIANPEIDQLSGRFNNRIGQFGIIICRNIESSIKLNNICKATLNNGQGYIIILCDEDIKKLICLRRDGELEAINNYLRDKFDELIL